MSNEPGQRADLGPRLEKTSVNCLCGCGRPITIKLWPGEKPPERQHKHSHCKRVERETLGDYWC